MSDLHNKTSVKQTGNYHKKSRINNSFKKPHTGSDYNERIFNC